MAQKLQVSLVIPVYNEDRHLRACLDAVAAQTVRPAEVLVIDNNSTDASLKIAKSYPFVTVLKEPKQGVVFARDRGFNAAKHQIIGRIDADSILSPDWTERVLEFYADRQNGGHCLTGGCYFYNIRLPHFAGWWQGQIAFRMNRLLMGHYILFGSNMAMPREVWQEVRGDVCDDTDVHEDLDLAIHAHRRGVPITYHETLKVGIKMRRVRSERRELWDNLMWWPKTLRRHGRWTWIFGWLGAVVLFIGSPLVIAAEYLARLLGHPPLPE